MAHSDFHKLELFDNPNICLNSKCFLKVAIWQGIKTGMSVRATIAT